MRVNARLFTAPTIDASLGVSMVGGVKALILLLVVVCVGCADPNEKANELFVEAVQLIASGDEQTGEASIKDYEQGLANIQTIIADYSESDLAVKLISGETLFTGKSLKEIKERVKELKRVAAEIARAVADPIVEAEIRKAIYKPKDELTKADLEKVTELNLQNNKLTDVSGLEKLTQLKKLYLDNNKLNEFPKGLEKLTQLTRLSLGNNQLSDVKGLEKLTKIKFLYLTNNPDLTKAQIDELQKALPKCEIISDPKK